jgi:photosystem II stability/assembly factor-like uncharacterized protein
MKTFITITFLLFIVKPSPSQWIQTSTPDGGGVTDMVVLSDGTLIVTTASFNWPSGQPGGIRRSTNGGASWQNIVNVFNGRSLWLGSTGKIFASYWPFPDTENLYESTDGGVSWQQIYWGAPNNNIFSIATKDNDNVIFIGKRNGVWRSINGGLWQPASAGIPPNTWVYDLDVNHSDGFIAAGTSKGLYVSSNNGNNWTAVSGISQTDTITKVIFDYAITSLDGSDQFDRLLAGSKSGSLFDGSQKSNYLLATLLAIFEKDEISGFCIIYLQSQNMKVHGVATFRGGFHVSTDNGNNWEIKNEGLPQNPEMASIGYHFQGINLLIYGGMFENSNGGAKIYSLNMPVGIQQISSEIPQVFELSQNYPNPFNPSTKIRFSLPNNELVKLVVYNSLGKEVAILLEQQLTQGSYEYIFDGNELSSGVYFYRLYNENMFITKRMILLK